MKPAFSGSNDVKILRSPPVFGLALSLLWHSTCSTCSALQRNLFETEISETSYLRVAPPQCERRTQPRGEKSSGVGGFRPLE